jgi:hypothetical protein
LRFFFPGHRDAAQKIVSGWSRFDQDFVGARAVISHRRSADQNLRRLGAHGCHQDTRPLDAAAQDSIAPGRCPALRDRFTGQMDDGVGSREGIRRDRATQRNRAHVVAGAAKVFGDGASDKPRSSGDGDVHSGNFKYRVARPAVFRVALGLGQNRRVAAT